MSAIWRIPSGSRCLPRSTIPTDSANRSKSSCLALRRACSTKNGMIVSSRFARRSTMYCQRCSGGCRDAGSRRAARRRRSCAAPPAPEALRSLSHDESGAPPDSRSCSLAAHAVWLPHEPDGGASLSTHKTDDPASPDQPFLLIVRITRHVVTTVYVLSTDTVSSAGYPEFPAYGRLHRTESLPPGASVNLRTVIVTAAVYRGLDSRLCPEGLTSPRNLPAPGRRQPLYVVFRLRRDLCFC